jgi:hypothetical protein
VSRRLTAVAVVLGLLGLSLVLAPSLYPGVPAGEVRHPTFAPTTAGECDATIEYADLPPRAQRSFDITPRDDLPRFNDTLYTGDDADAVNALETNDCVRQDGQYYGVDLIHRDGSFLGDSRGGPVVLGLVALGAAVVVWRRA